MSADLLRPQHGMHVTPSWLQQLQSHATQLIPNFSHANQSTQQDLLWQNFMQGDLHKIGQAVLPENIQTWHNRQLSGLFVLQVDEVVNIAAAAKQRQEEAADKRCLKLMLTDGAHQLSGLEYRYIQGLKVSLPAGAKIAVKDATVRHGVLMLTPDNTLLLGGQVHDLEQARQRAAKRWAQAPSGRSSRQETGPVDLYAAASAAAWSQDTQPSDTPALPGPIAQPGPAARSVVPSCGLHTHPPQRNALVGAAQVDTLPGSALPVSGPAATQQAPCFTLAYEAAYTPPEQLQQRQQASAVIPRIGSAVASSARALPSDVGAVQRTALVNLPNTNGAASNINYAAAINSAPVSSGQSIQPLRSAPMHNPHLARHPSGTSRLRLQPALAAVPGAHPTVHTAAIEISPAQSGNTGEMPSYQPPRVALAAPALPQTTAASASHMAGTDDLPQHTDTHASKPNRKRHRQLIDSSSEDEAETSPAKRHAAAALHAQRAIQKDTHGADFEDYGNEPQMDEEMDGVPDMYDDAEASDSLPQQQQCGAVHQTSHATSLDGALCSPSGLVARQMSSDRPAMQSPLDLTNDQQSHEQMHPAASHRPEVLKSPVRAAACTAVLQDKQLQAIDALHRLPYTTLQAITEHATHLPPSDFPKTLRLNAKLVRTLSRLQFIDPQSGDALDQYAIDVEIQDESDKCRAALGHHVLLSAIGLSTKVLSCKFKAGGKEAITANLNAMNAAMLPYMSKTLVDIVLKHSTAKPVVVEWHDQWTDADRASM